MGGRSEDWTVAVLKWLFYSLFFYPLDFYSSDHCNNCAFIRVFSELISAKQIYSSKIFGLGRNHDVDIAQLFFILCFSLNNSGFLMAEFQLKRLLSLIVQPKKPPKKHRQTDAVNRCNISVMWFLFLPWDTFSLETGFCFLFSQSNIALFSNCSHFVQSTSVF